MANTRITTVTTSQGEIRLGARQLRILGAFEFTETGVLPATVWSSWSRTANKPKGLALADVLVALKEKGLIEPTDDGLFDLFAARLLPDYRITDLGREVLA